MQAAPAQEAEPPVEKPKRAKSAYFVFAEQRRSSLKSENPTLRMPEVAKLLGKEWRELTAEGKKTYEDLSRKDKERFDKEEQKYVDYLTRTGVLGPTPDPSTRAPPKPKRPMSAYFVFMQANRVRVKNQNPTCGLGGVAKLLGLEWKGMKPEARKQYVEAAAADKKRYLAEMEEYKKNNPNWNKKPAARKGSAAEAATIFLPLSRVKKIAQSNDDMCRMTREASWLLAKATETYLAEFARAAQQCAARSGRKGILPRDADWAVRNCNGLWPLRTSLEHDLRALAEKRKHMSEIAAHQRKRKREAAQAASAAARNESVAQQAQQAQIPSFFAAAEPRGAP